MCATEVLSPPDNISVSVKDGELSVTWALPSSKDTENPECFEYQLDLGDKVQYVCMCYFLMHINKTNY